MEIFLAEVLLRENWNGGGYPYNVVRLVKADSEDEAYKKVIQYFEGTTYTFVEAVIHRTIV